MIFIIIELQFLDQLIVSSAQLKELNEVVPRLSPCFFYTYKRNVFS